MWGRSCGTIPQVKNWCSFLWIVLLLAACTPQTAPVSVLPPVSASPVPAVSPVSEPTPSFLASVTPTLPPTATPQSTHSPTPTHTLTLALTPTPHSPFPLSPPVLIPDTADPLFSVIDPSYRFASTQAGLRPVHHGVEFLLPFGSPVLAAAEGTVLFAGNDNIRGPYGPPRRHNYLGNFIVLEHPATLLAERGLGETVFYTVYAHLSELNVQTGDTVRAGDQIGLIGFTGAALGPHLHFEVRLTGFTHADSFNPELFLNLPGRGVLAGRLLSEKGTPLLNTFNITALDTGKTLYITPYEDAKLAVRPPYRENFGLSLPPGSYELTYIISGIHTVPFEIRAGEVTFLEITQGE